LEKLLETSTGKETPSEASAIKFAENLIRDLQQEWRGALLTLERPNLPLKEAENLTQRISATVQPHFSETEPRQRQLLQDHARAVVRCFLSTKELVTGVDERGLVDLAKMSVASCCDSNYFEDLELRVGFGGAALDSPNVRSAAYLVAPKQILLQLARTRHWIEVFHKVISASEPRDRKKLAKLKNTVLAGKEISGEKQEQLRDLEAMAANLLIGDGEKLFYPEQLPRVVVYSAGRFLGATNGQSDQLLHNAEQTQAFLRAYIDRTCPPNVAGRFSFDDDRATETTPLLMEQVNYWAEAVEQAESPEALDVQAKIARLSSKHAGNAKAGLRYAVAHAAYSADDVPTPPVPILRHHAAQPTKVIMIGGPPEKLFWKVRQVVCETANTSEGAEFLRQQALDATCSEQRQVIKALLRMYETADVSPVLRTQLLSRVGEIPVYSAECHPHDPSCREVAETGLSLKQVVTIDKVRTSVKEDLVVLLQDISRLDIKNVRALAKGKIQASDLYRRGSQQLQEISEALF